MAGQDEVVGLPVEDGARRKNEVLRRDHMSDHEVGHGDLDLRRDVGGLDLEGDRVLVHDDHDVAGVLTDRDELHLDRDLLAAPHDDEVDVLNVAVDRVLLDLFRQRELLLAPLDLDLEEHVRDAQRELGLVARKADVYGIGAVAVQHGRYLVRATQTTCCALAEFGALRGAQSDLVGHGDSPQPRMSDAALPRRSSSEGGPSRSRVAGNRAAPRRGNPHRLPDGHGRMKTGWSSGLPEVTLVELLLHFRIRVGDAGRLALTQLDATDLAGDRLRQLVDELDDPHPLVRAEPLTRVLEDLLGGALRVGRDVLHEACLLYTSP